MKHYVNQGLSHSFCKGSDGNYFILCRPYGLSLLFFLKVNMICGPQFITPDVIARDCVLNDINFFMPVPICTKDAMITYGHIQVIGRKICECEL